jgi:hypothetical protein
MITKVKRFKKWSREGWPWCFVLNLSIHQDHYCLTLDNVKNGDDWGNQMNLFHYQLSHWLTINKLKPITPIVGGDNFVQVNIALVNFLGVKLKILMERTSLFHLEINWMENLVNVTYLGASKCLSIWLETYICVVNR